MIIFVMHVNEQSPHQSDKCTVNKIKNERRCSFSSRYTAVESVIESRIFAFRKADVPKAQQD